MDIIIGIDLGTTFSCVGYWADDHVVICENNQGKKTTPSWVFFDEDEILIGEAAKRKAMKKPQNVLFDIKRIIGKKYYDESVQDDLENLPFKMKSDKNGMPLIEVDGKNYRAEQISGLVLSHMKEIAENKIGQKINKAVITVPAYFNDSERKATRDACTIAGMECVKIINEPTAACLCYGLQETNEDKKILIFDLGGGTFDVSLLNLSDGVFEVLATAGNTHLGGEDFDYILMNYLINEFEKENNVNIRGSKKTLRMFKKEAERCKCVLSNSNYVEIELDNVYLGNDFYMKLLYNGLEIVVIFFT